ncbi:MAG: formylglycine-generating enzyme family protein [Desulfatirhabdiaceae bacterium]
MRPKQDPVFSMLEEMESDIFAFQKGKDRFPTEKIPAETTPEPPAENRVAIRVTIPLPDMPMPQSHETPFCDAPFVYVPPGIFIMGSAIYEPGRNRDETQHEVTITRGFSMQTTPVTQGQWKSIMGNNPSCFLQGGDQRPVESVTWNECHEFITRLNGVGEFVYRLPTEAEWEYACRSGAATSFCNGEITELFCRRDTCLDATGWYCYNSDRMTHPVAGKYSNTLGLFDMHGNVCEWCQDWYGDYAATPQSDPRGPAFGPGRVVRGGSWFSNAQNCRSASRFYCAPNTRSDFVGFRLVREH